MKKVIYKNVKHLVMAAALPFCLSACDMAVPSQMSLDKIRLMETMQTSTIDLARLDHSKVDAIVRHYKRHGNGPVSLTVAYPAGDAAAEKTARGQGTALARYLRESGIDAVKTDFVQIAPEAYQSQAVLGFVALGAQPPKNCAVPIPGHTGDSSLGDMDAYLIGCETSTNLSKMLAHPEDLTGRAGVAPSESRRQGAVIENHRSGTRNPPLRGYTASGMGN